ncbi:WecB/TagA/CpsF family glycosyltransferase [Alloacidobacterium dinghuense]|uniref:WecB/TagA/CpsF family glycosyltransferase n=1 Tax=Alloacidobacterium dinghuense TaxID=2763107 RepID=A0A7G8BKJ2_9BACT|nr:WecB/TagA/CpsF family glycosyltransferase [Alloacidobacterium dinghuense]QNI33062.1 WecB/TagA/CpsF family glycosyltransferase [Alloacidobacterium dinghuense]
MRQLGKKNVIGILIDAVDYEASVNFILRAAHERRPAAVSALAVHGVMTGVLDPAQKFRLNHFDLLVPDGQPVRWVLNWLHQTKLDDRVYGPNLTLRVCVSAAAEGLPIYLYGSTAEVLAALRKSLEERFPAIRIAGSEPSKFRRLTTEEKEEIAERIVGSGAAITFVGMGCPRQEIFAYEFRDALSMPVLAVGAAFPFIAGRLAQAPAWMQDRGLEWLFRLCAEPKRLWRRYLYLNPAYLFLVALQASRLSRFATEGTLPVEEVLAG